MTGGEGDTDVGCGVGVARRSGAGGEGGGVGDVWGGEGPGWVYTINADDTLALVTTMKQGSRNAVGNTDRNANGPSGTSTEVALRSKNDSARDSSRRSSCMCISCVCGCVCACV